MRVFDSHAHLNDERYDEDREAVIERTLAELASISGVGDRKLEAYGAAILEIVTEAG